MLYFQKFDQDLCIHYVVLYCISFFYHRHSPSQFYASSSFTAPKAMVYETLYVLCTIRE